MKTIMSRITKTRELSSLLFLVGMFLVVGLFNPSFLSIGNLFSSFNLSVMYILLSVGIAFVLMTGEIDVSIGSTIGLCGAVLATYVRDGKSLWIAIPLTLLIGAVIGIVNGFAVAKMKVPSIIMTLGTMGIIRGLIFIYTKSKWVENLPDAFKRYSQLTVFGYINVFLLITVILVAVIHLYLTRSKKGKYFKAVGDNVGGATLIGIPVASTQIIAFVLSGVFAALASIVFVSSYGFVSPTAGSGYEMTAIAACVLGGISLSGGVGSMIGAAVGAVIMATLSRALIFLKIPSDWTNSIIGILLIAIVVADVMIQKRSNEKARRQRLKARVVTTEAKE